MRPAVRGVPARLCAPLVLAAGLAASTASAMSGARAPALAPPAAAQPGPMAPAAGADVAVLAGRAVPGGAGAAAAGMDGAWRALVPTGAAFAVRLDEAGRVPRRPRRVVPRGIERPMPALPRPRVDGATGLR